jgi:hypothetical protein
MTGEARRCTQRKNASAAEAPVEEERKEVLRESRRYPIQNKYGNQ